MNTVINAPSEVTTRRLPLDLLDAMESVRTLDELNVERLVLSIGSHGLLQLPVVIPRDDRFWIAAGNHRCEALRRTGRTHVDCHVLPEGTTLEKALAVSLHENNVRQEECLADLTRRVNALNDYHRCKTRGELARMAGMSESMLSKVQKALKTLTPESIGFANERRIGWTVAYTVASRAKSPEEQLAMLHEYARGERTRSQIAEVPAKAPEPRKPRAAKPKPLTIRRVEGQVRFGLQLPHEATHRVLIEALESLLTHLQSHERSGEPLAAFNGLS